MSLTVPGTVEALIRLRGPPRPARLIPSQCATTAQFRARSGTMEAGCPSRKRVFVIRAVRCDGPGPDACETGNQGWPQPARNAVGRRILLRQTSGVV